MRQTLFSAAGLRAVALDADDIPALQTFFEANPEYFLDVMGAPPTPNQAHDEFFDDPPSDISWTKRQVLGFFDADDALLGMAHVVHAMMTKDLWHIGTFIIATPRHGQGQAQQLYTALEAWSVAGGAKWLRLGVVQGNARAERFWQRCGYVELKLRRGLTMGQRINNVRVMLKPLAGQTTDAYLALVARDRPETQLKEE